MNSQDKSFFFLTHELLQHVLLLLLIAALATRLLLALVIHHLLDHTAGLAVQVAELAVLGRDLGRVDLGCGRHDVRPPFHLVAFVEVDAQFFLARGQGFEGPGAVVGDYRVRERALGCRSWGLVGAGLGGWAVGKGMMVRL